MTTPKNWILVLFAGVILTLPLSVTADQNQDLAKQLANPVASLISVPIDYDFDDNLGPVEKGKRMLLVAKPVIPLDINESWNLITRTIVPFVKIEDFAPGVNDESGLSDIQASLFFSPKAPTAGGWIWGAGPIFLFPTASEELLGSEKWGLGPTGVMLKQDGPLTYGVLSNQVWSYAGDDDRDDYNRFFIQPFLSFTTSAATTFTVQTESTYDWESHEWSVPINLITSQVVKLGDQLLQIRGGIRYWVNAPDNLGPDDWGIKLGLSFLFPK